ncbi:MAG: septal ring lytic transglycosylase RlpA family protein [Synechococcales bacterium]|nr:septal ring lytic transglycosylase RlpA family protein [Synechococcales bacterium]
MSFLKFICISSYVGSLLSLSSSIGVMVKQSQVAPVEAGEPVLAGVLMTEDSPLTTLQITERGGAVEYRSTLRSPLARSTRPTRIIVPLKQLQSLGDRPFQMPINPMPYTQGTSVLLLTNLQVNAVEQVDPLIQSVADWSKALPDQLPSQPATEEATASGDDLLLSAPDKPQIDWSQVCSNGPVPPGDEIPKYLASLVETDRTLQGIASWYGPYFHGRQTASGEAFNQEALTAAHPHLPFGTLLKVTNLQNRRTVVVRINDRGPYIGRRSLDLSRKAAQCLGSITAGIVPYRATILEKAPQTISQSISSLSLPQK